VSDPATYEQEDTTLMDTLDSLGSIRQMEMRAGAPNFVNPVAFRVVNDGQPGSAD